ncbi:MAG TPA: type II toxin-antitoxin system MqsA family antitoxin [Anaerolineales bacterium]|nr:type II toxin-antitoxin system MqsA family antitoxin [Anaerolineales bacterium]
MKCVVCKQAETRPSTTSVLLERDGRTLVIKNVPARVCENCGEAYVDEKVTDELLEQAEELVQTGTQVEIRQYTVA